MVRIVLFLIICFSLKQSAGQGFHSFEDSLTGKYGYQNSSGEIVIQPQFDHCFSEEFENYGFVARHDSGLIAIDSTGRMLYKVYVMDNGPDYPSEKMFRVIRGSLIGYADEGTGKIVIEPGYKKALPFRNGLAAFCSNPNKEDKQTEKWGYIDRKGKVVIQPIFDEADSFENGKAYVKKGSERFIIDKKGVRQANK